MKKCITCEEEKPLSEYYKHQQMGDGHLNKCKECVKQYQRCRALSDCEKIRDYEKSRANLPHRIQARKEYAQSAKGKDAIARAAKKYKEVYPLKRAAHVITGNAIRDGRLIKQPCEVCGIEKAQAHHDDYEKPLDVRWLCRKHHLEVHGKVAYKEVL